MKDYYFAVDLGATSGRTTIGSIVDGRLQQQVITRFPNNLIQTGHHFYWDIYALYFEIIRALKEVARQGLNITSIGIDTWGVDFVFIGNDHAILRNPLAYRDPHTFNAFQQYIDHVLPRREVYQITGIQLININSLYQLYAMQQARNSAMQVAEKILFIPDALSWMLTGQAVCEQTIASTSQMLDPRTKEFSPKLLQSVGIKPQQFPPIVMPGTQIGTLTEEIQKLTGLPPVPVIAVAGHDTASAVAAVPAKDNQFAFLSSGTWSLMGIEASQPIINEHSYQYNFTNEAGVESTNLFLKNICGLWLYEQCRSEWPEDLRQLSHSQLQQEAMTVQPFRSMINPDDPLFANPPSMIHAIQHYCQQTGQPVPQTPGEICRCIFDSLAMTYKQVFQSLQQFSTHPLNTLHIIGGGSLNKYLNQFTANATGVTVIAGPQECTAIGNIMMQAKAAGKVKDLWEMRRMIAASVELERYEPQDKESWDVHFDKFLNIINKSKTT